MVEMYQQAPRQQYNHHDDESRYHARMTAQISSDTRPNKHTPVHTAAPAVVRRHRMIAPKPRSHSSGDLEFHLFTCQDDHSNLKDDKIMGGMPFPLPTYTTQTSVAVGVARPRQFATPGIHRRLCFSLDEKALFDLHHPQYSSTTSQQQSSSEQSPQRMAMEPMKPPFAPPERVRTPDGIPSWPGVVETCAHTQQQYGTMRESQQRRGGTWSRIKARLFDRNNRKSKGKGKRTRIRRALSFKRPREEPRTFAPWRPPMSGHSAFRFDD